VTGPPPPTWAVAPDAAGAREILPGLWRLRLPLSWPGIDHVNAYLIAGDDGAVLVDCGSGGDPSCLAALEQAIALTGHELTDVSALVLTHVHSDHAGMARTVLARSGAELWCHPDTGHFYDALRDPERVERARRVRALKEGVPLSRVAPYASVEEELTGVDGVVESDHPLLNGTQIPSGLGSWEVIETPGHAPSHVSLLQREHGLLIAGDIVCLVFVPWMDYGFTADPFAESLGSLDLLSGIGPVGLTLPGHGRALEDLQTTIASHRSGYARMLDAVRRAVRDRAGTAYELTEGLFGTEPDIAAVGHLSEVLTVLRHLRLNGEVQRVVSDDGLHRYDRCACPLE
jgi:glyoxylase-like metal-dependent hydrolase (beta-lactamase superfamily II)